VRVHIGDCLTVLRTIPAQSIHSCITSPPYFQQRDYGIAGQIGLEPTAEEYINRLVDVFRELRRVLRQDGTLWLNIGDAFAKIDSPASRRKDLLGLPWRLAFALQQDGWYLRQDIVVHKANPMPEPVRDRCARAHEYLFLFTKRRRYHFNAEAIRERGVTTTPGTAQRDTRDTHGAVSSGNTGLNAAKQRMREELSEKGFVTRHKRSVWTVAGARNRHGHYAAFPEALVEPCIMAGCPEGGTVLDPFAGSGTVGRVAKRLGRSAELIEINPEYVELAQKRCA
jgi:site-specific DNA-methyltransferase (adenine-specific)